MVKDASGERGGAPIPTELPSAVLAHLGRRMVREFWSSISEKD